MSSYLYGSLSQRRVRTPPQTELAFEAVPAIDGEPQLTPSTRSLITDKVSHWQDAAAALVPAEVLVVHGMAMNLGTTTTGSGDDAVTRITRPGEMAVVYVALMVLSAVLYLLGARTVKGWKTWIRAVVPVVAFMVWTMIQPSTAFDAFAFDLSSFARTMIAVFGAIILGLTAKALASSADQETQAGTA